MLVTREELVASFEKSADGRKLSKERFSINASTMKLPLQLTGKVNLPRYFTLLRVDLYTGCEILWP